jgi:hypothetical protein
MLVLKSEDDIALILVEAFSKGRGEKSFKQLEAVYKKALAKIQENSQAQEHAHAASLGQFLRAPVKGGDVDFERVLGSSFNETCKDYCMLYQLTYSRESQRKGESTRTESTLYYWMF